MLFLVLNLDKWFLLSTIIVPTWASLCKALVEPTSRLLKICMHKFVGRAINSDACLFSGGRTWCVLRYMLCWREASSTTPKAWKQMWSTTWHYIWIDPFWLDWLRSTFGAISPSPIIIATMPLSNTNTSRKEVASALVLVWAQCKERKNLDCESSTSDHFF